MNIEKAKKEILKQFQEKLWEDINSYGGGYIDLADYDFGDYSFQEIDALEVQDGGKYSNGGTVYEAFYKGKSLGLNYLLEWSRTGSYYSYFDYSYDDYPYVAEKKEKVIYVWEEA